MKQQYIFQTKHSFDSNMMIFCVKRAWNVPCDAVVMLGRYERFVNAANLGNEEEEEYAEAEG
jgi:hypothetical protein